MLFNEVYGAYYNAVAAILSEAVKGEVTDKRIYEIVRDKAFSESVLTIPAALKDGAWPLIAKDGSTPIKHEPKMPLTELQRRWLKALLSDPRIKLFVIDETGLEDVEPLYKPDVFVYFDRYSDGDDFDDPRYIENFRTILTALREKRQMPKDVLPKFRKKQLSIYQCMSLNMMYLSIIKNSVQSMKIIISMN